MLTHRRERLSLLALLSGALIGMVTTAAPVAAEDCRPVKRPSLAGVVLTDLCNRDDSVVGVAVENDGAVIVAATTSVASGAGRTAVVRYEPDGALDEHFGEDGIAVDALPDDMDFRAAGADVADDGSIFLAGTVQQKDRKGRSIAILRYTRTGELNDKFGDKGVVITNVTKDSDDEVTGIELGSADQVFVTATSRSGVDHLGQIVLLGLANDGKRKDHFGKDGVAHTGHLTSGSDDMATGLDVRNDDSIVVVGASRAGKGDTNQLALIRYTKEGARDEKFDGDGVVIDPRYELPASGVIMDGEDDGRVVIAAITTGKVGTPGVPVLMRYTISGEQDTKFGEDGVVTLDLGGDPQITSIVVQDDGSVVVAGTGRDSRDKPRKLVVMRYLHDGKLDTGGFGDKTGQVSTVLPDPQEFEVTSVDVEKGGKITAAGTSRAIDSPGDIAVARFELDGEPDGSWKPFLPTR